ncbi:MAG: Orotate phosphoribosyltransferase [Alphaproteobacteria bacterium MarineAlpha5_Bin8]|nr:MAG: Orotate phosphoribosyltransferase [Alphaproteobacteria bacterium MarineAlpha5_Bin7]PPR48416.1 MAG: Orotate phosphoribosyltransferase [Alphaproteobacteria bacterium MarineAlpha5_Bin8]PPR54413.1 MAG: Orotate phosphoribosyltransferase [Alphaproteobacteria bacterium MarineAlpha5_Bin6]|tara:strand:- start:747 stop:1397 length:651 start_codon:yes stop_codon:yes gene_type:complete
MKNYNYNNQVAEILLEIEAIKFSFKELFILTSGKKSPVYVDCRKLISFIEERNKILNYANEYFINQKIKFDILAGGETAGIPYAAFLSQILQKKMIYVRKQSKGFGKNKQIEGFYEKGQKAILIEDLATDGGSKVSFIETMRKNGLLVSDIFVIFYYDIFDLKKSPLSSMDVKIHSLCTWKNILEVMSIKKMFSNSEIENIKNFLADPDKWRNKYG